MQHADLILHNGKLHTVDPERPEATAVAIRDGGRHQGRRLYRRGQRQ